MDFFVTGEVSINCIEEVVIMTRNLDSIGASEADSVAGARRSATCKRSLQQLTTQLAMRVISYHQR